MTAYEVRTGIAAALRNAAPDYWLLALFAATATNLLDFAVLPAPGERPGAAFLVAAVVRVVAVFWATYGIARRMTAIPRPLVPGAALLRFALFMLLWLAAFGAFGQLVGKLAVLPARPLATQWLILLAANAAFGIVLIRLVGIAAALAGGARFDQVGDLVRGTRGAALGLSLAFVQVVLPFAAVHLALTLVGVRLPLSGAAVAALALVDGVVSAAQLLCSTALSVVAWQRAAPALRDRRAQG